MSRRHNWVDAVRRCIPAVAVALVVPLAGVPAGAAQPVTPDGAPPAIPAAPPDTPTDTPESAAGGTPEARPDGPPGPAPTAGIAAAGPASFAHDANGRLAGVVGVGGEVARYTYDAAGNLTGVERLGTPAVAVLSVVPQRARPGDTLTVTGVGFATTPAGNAVTVNGTAATVTSATDRRLVLTVPAAATSGDLRVTTSAGSATFGGITVVTGDRPVVTGFTPTTAAPGTSVTVSATNTDPEFANNLVRVNGLLATVTARDSGTLTVTVPPAASTGRVSLTTPAGTVASTGVLVVPPAAVPPESIDTAGPITVGTRTAIPLAANKYALRHFEAADGDRFAVLLDGGTVSSCSVTATLYDERNQQAASSSCVGVSGWVDTTARSGAGMRSLVLRHTGATTGTLYATVLRVPDDVNAGTQALDGTPLVFTLPDPGRDVYSTFAGTTGQRVIVQSSAASSSFGCCYLSWRLLAPDGTTVGSARNPNEFLDTVTLPQNGTYRIVMNPDTNRIGSMTVAAWTVPADVDAGTQVLDGTVKVLGIPTPGNIAYSTFAGTTGQRVILQSSASSSSFGCCYMAWRLVAPNGAVVGSARNPNDFLDTVTLPQTGTYRIEMNPDGSRVGSTTIAAWDVPADVNAGTQALDGTPLVLGIPTPGNLAYSTFTGAVDQRVIIQSSASSSSFGCCYMAWRLVAPDGAVVGTARNPNDFLDTIRLPQAGTYRIEMNPDGSRVGSTTIAAWTVPADVDAGTQVLDGAAKVLAIPTPGNIAYSTFAGTTGQRVILQSSASSSSFGCCYMAWRLVAPNGAVVGSARNPNDFLDTVTLPQTGTYRIEMNPEGTRVGSTTIAAWDVPADVNAGAQALDGTPLVLGIPTPGNVAFSTFTGTTGQRVIVQSSATSSSFGCCYMSWRLYAPDGAAVGAARGPNEVLDTIALPQTGTYRIVMNPEGSRVGSTTIAAWDVPADVNAGTQALNGTPLVLGIPTPGNVAFSTFAGTTGQKVIIGSSATSSSFGCCYMSWRLYAPDGAAVGAARGPNEVLDTIALPQTGTYRIVMNPEGIRVGSTTIAAWDVPADANAGVQPLNNTPLVLTVANPGTVTYSTFTGTTGQSLTVRSSATSASFGCCAMTWRLLAPNGAQVGSSRGPNATLTVTLPQTGGYQLVMNPDGVLTGSTTLTATVAGTLATPAQVQAAQAALTAGVAATAAADAAGVAAVVADAVASRQAGRATVAAPAARAAAPDADPGATDRPRAPPAEVTPTDLQRLSQWTPDEGNLRGHDWLTRRPDPAPVKNLEAPAGVTAVSGHVLDLDARPLAGIPVRMGEVHTSTDAHGRFLLAGVPTTATTVVVDGYAAETAPARYGTFRIRARVEAGRTTALDSTVWLPRLDMKNTVRLPASATTRETVLRTPAIPGLEVRIPAGTVVRDLDGAVVTELGITAIPLDRPPYALPRNGIVPTYFTVQPGGSTIFPQGASVVYPNYTGLPAGTTVDFWDYDAADRGWHVYGHGTVTADGRQVVPDADTRLWTLDGSMFNTPGNPEPDDPWWKDLFDWLSGDPVDLSTGLLTDTHTDLAVADTMPVTLTRAYYQGDGNERQFGLNQSTDYDLFLTSAQQYQEVDLNLPGGGRVHYVRTSPGTGYSDAVFGTTGSGGRYAGSTIAQISGDWVLSLRDGTKYFFPWYSRVRAIQDRNGNQITFTRTGGSNGEVSRVTSPNGRWIGFEYDSSDRVTRATDNIGRTVTYTYDGSGRLATVTDVAGRTRTYTYDSAHRITAITDGRGVTYLTATYDANGRVATQTVAGGGSYAFDYTLDAGGAVTETRVTQPNGSVRRVVFDPVTRTAVSDTDAYGTALARTTTLVRGQADRVDAVVDPYGRRTEFAYDGADRPTAVTELAGTGEAVVTSSATYGPFDQPLTTTDATGGVTTYTYDLRGNPLTVTDPLGNTTTLTWTAAGQLATATSPTGAVTRFTHESGGLVAVQDPLGRTWRRFVDAAGRTVTSTDPLGATTQHTYDAQNQVTGTTDPLGGRLQYGYDANGNLTSFTDQRGKTTTWTFDDADRAVSHTAPGAAAASMSYDPAGRLTASTTAAGVRTTSAYDALDRPTLVRYGVDGGSAQSQVTYAYDAFDRLASLTDSAGGTVSFGYDARDRVTSVTGPNGTVTHTYDAEGRRTGTGLPGQPVTTYGYDAAGRLTAVTRGSDTTGVAYDAAWRPTTITLPGGWTQSFTHDAASQVTAIAYAHGATPQGGLTYGYDGAGQRDSVGGSYANVAMPAARSGLVYDDANRLVSVDGVPLTYDADGNLTGDGTTAYTWNARGNLVGTTSAAVTASFAYDATGVRSSRTVDGDTTRFLHDGPNVAAELDAGGAVTATLQSGDLDTWFARNTGGSTDTVLTDALGSPLAFARADGTLASTHTYDPFGTPTTTGDPRGSDLTFTGRQDDGTGLVHNRARYYSPALQRFVSEDPIGLAGGTNLYAYANNSPVNYTDPTGNNPLLVGCLAGAAIDGGLDYLGQRLGGRKVDWGSVGASALGGCLGGMLGGLGRAGKAANHLCSFTADTRVTMADGSTRRIADIEVGDQVLAVDPETGERGARTVTHLWVHEDTLVDLDLDGRTISTTEDHPFWNATDKQWQAAAELDRGDRLVTAGGEQVTIGGLRAATARTGTAYNLTVDDLHTFFADGVLVHNTCDLFKPGKYAKDSIPARGPGRDFTRAERDALNDIGNQHGCHSCGATNPGTKHGDWVPDHQPVTSQNPNNLPQRLYPQCLSCSRQQGLQAARRGR